MRGSDAPRYFRTFCSQGIPGNPIRLGVSPSLMHVQYLAESQIFYIELSFVAAVELFAATSASVSP